MPCARCDISAHSMMAGLFQSPQQGGMLVRGRCGERRRGWMATLAQFESRRRGRTTLRGACRYGESPATEPAGAGTSALERSGQPPYYDCR